MPFTIGMSQDYRFYDDRWRVDKNVKDEMHDVSATFAAAEGMMKDISDMLKGPISETDMEAVMLEEMAAAVFASNQRARVGLDLDETLKICLQVFRGEVYQYSERYVEKITYSSSYGILTNRQKPRLPGAHRCFCVERH